MMRSSQPCGTAPVSRRMGDSSRVVLRELARQDVETAVDWYREEAGEQTALRFVTALEVALGHIARYPNSGSARYSMELGMPGLRCWQLERFPYLAFYVQRDDHIDVWRVLHGHRDIPGWMRDPDEPAPQE
jgi:toxin ParE1/3/4